MKKAILVALPTAWLAAVANFALAQSAPPQPTNQPSQLAQQIRPSDADYAKAQLQVLLDTVQRQTPLLVEARAQISALEERLSEERAHVADLEHKLANATKTTPDKPVDFDKPAATPAAPPAAPVDKAK